MKEKQIVLAYSFPTILVGYIKSRNARRHPQNKSSQIKCSHVKGPEFFFKKVYILSPETLFRKK